MNDLLPPTTRPGVGHNSLAAEADADRLPALKEAADALSKVVDEWTAKVKEVRDEEEAGRARDLQAVLTLRLKELEKAFDAEKAPWLAGGRAVDEKFRPVRAVLEASKEMIGRLLARWSAKESARIEAEKVKAKAEADAAVRAAEAAVRAAEATKTVAAVVAAEEATKLAQAATKVATKAAAARVQIKSATGGAKAASPRVYLSARLENFPAACRHFASHPDVVATLERLATAELRARAAAANKGRTTPDLSIPGFKTIESEKIV